MRESHRVVPRTELEFLIWGDDPPEHDALRVHLHTLRHEVDLPGDARLLHTIRGFGYRLCSPDEL
jgi:DNA-binding response OmpR family regulator